MHRLGCNKKTNMLSLHNAHDQEKACQQEAVFPPCYCTLPIVPTRVEERGGSCISCSKQQRPQIAAAATKVATNLWCAHEDETVRSFEAYPLQWAVVRRRPAADTEADELLTLREDPGLFAEHFLRAGGGGGINIRGE